MKINIDISEYKVENLISLALEDFGYGSFIMTSMSSDSNIPLCRIPLTEDGVLCFKDKYGDCDDTLRLNRKAVEKGLKIMAKKYPKHFNDFIADNDDVLTGDVFIQCALLGEYVYCQ